MQIPIQNIYYLLCYAWDKLEEKNIVNVTIDDKTELLDLFAKILINATKRLLKRGIDKSYMDNREEIAGAKGKILISDTLKSNLLYKQRTICTYDDFTSNILLNRIFVSTLTRLTRTKGLDKQLAHELMNLKRMFFQIDEIEITSAVFKRLRFHRNNRFYSFLMNVCQIVYECTLPSEEAGTFKFSDFTRDDKKMNQLFEAFIRNFYRREQNKFKKVNSENIEWQLGDLNRNYLPIMKTDISLENDDEKVIIDAKYYRETMSEYYDKEKIKSVNLYQLFSYLLNQEEGTEKSLRATGMLLYPTIDKNYNLNYHYRQHKILIRTINLNQNWKSISERLKEIVGVGRGEMTNIIY